MPLFGLCLYASRASQLKIIMYLLTRASEDIESQKKGVVILIWPGMCQSVTSSNIRLLESLNDRRRAILLQNGVPMRVVCIHFGSASSPLLRFVRILLVTVMQERSRSRFHISTGEFELYNRFFVLVHKKILVALPCVE